MQVPSKTESRIEVKRKIESALGCMDNDLKELFRLLGIYMQTVERGKRKEKRNVTT